ncbi:MAG: Rrf2 family transcriptional regulator [Clostridiales bacterium]|nr:Rrf2 family transcriptional regulator [Clostridiales bacterium]
MRITQEADYALRIVYQLARDNCIKDAKAIAEAVNVPERFTVKILRKLVLNKIVRSRKGAQGGYELEAKPEDISMKRIVEIIDGPLVISRCLDSSYECSRNGDNKKCCTFHLVFDKINSSIMEKLDSITLDMIVSESVGIDDILSKI